MRHHIISALGLMLVLCKAAAAQDIPITPLRDDLAQRTFEAACSACHYRGAGKPPFGTRGPTAEDSPDELAQYILFGKAPEYDEGGMPAFGLSLTDADVTRLLVWLRSTAKAEPPWTDVTARVAAMRATGQRED